MKDIIEMKDRPECQIAGPTQGIGGAPRYCLHLKTHPLRIPPIVINLVTMDQVIPNAMELEERNPHNKTITWAYLLATGIYRIYRHGTGDDGEEDITWETILIPHDLEKMDIGKAKPSVIAAIVALCKRIF